MTALVDTSVLIDVLRGRHEALAALTQAREEGPLHASEITRTEVLAGMRPGEEPATRAALDALSWHPVDRDVAERGAELARRWRPSHSGVDIADFLIAATCELVDARLITCNTKHFPMFTGLRPPY